MTMSNAALKLVHEAEMVENDPGRSDIPPVLNGLWWNLGAGRDAMAMVSNMSPFPVTADVYLDFQGKRHASAPLDFTPNETKALSITKLLGDLELSPSQAPQGGITIIARGPNPKLVAVGRVLDPATGFSTTLEFPDPALQRTSALHASGIPVGTPPKGSPFADTGNFTPHVVARNLLATPQMVIVTVEYPQAGALWNSTAGPTTGKTPPTPTTGISETSDGGARPTRPPLPDPDMITGRVALAPLSVPPFSTVDFSFDAVLGQLPLPLPYCSIRVQHTGAPGTLVAQVSSVDHGQDLVVDAHLANEGDGWAGSGANPWHLDNETESILFLTDGSDKPARIGFSVAANGVRYDLTSLRLSAHETRAINLRQLRDAQAPDFRGNKIPADATDGSVNWIRLDNVPVSSRMLVLKRHGGVASNYNCGTCHCPPGYTSLSVSPGSATVAAGGTAHFNATSAFTDCNYFTYYYDVTSGSSWSSGNTSVATVNGAGLVTGQGGGSTSISATYYDCTYYWIVVEQMCGERPIGRTAGGTANVQVPTYFSIVAGTSTTSSEATCTVTNDGQGCGASRVFDYQVLDSSLSPIRIAGMQVWDSIQTGSPNNLNLGGYTTTCSHAGMTNSGPCGVTTNSAGQFQDIISVCAQACTSTGQGGYCILAGPTNAQTTWHVAGYTLTSDVKTYSYYCDHYLVNGQ